MDYFALEAHEYKRDIDPIGHSIQQYAYQLHKTKKIPIEQARAFVLGVIKKNKTGAIRNPSLTFMERQENGDRIEKTTSVREYIGKVINDGDVIAPSGTTYLHRSKKESFISGFIKEKKKKRKTFKHAEFEAKARGDIVGTIANNNASTAQKLANNGISGAQVSPSTPLSNKTGHSTLTSTCQITAGYGNCSNEKLLQGNRHYYHPDIVLNNIWAIASNSNYVEISRIIEKYNLYIPSAEDVMECITYSTDLYWRSSKHLAVIEKHVAALDSLERAAFIYTGDLYHVAKHNPVFMREMIAQLSRKVEFASDVTVKQMQTLDSDDVILAHHICFSEMRGMGMRYEEVREKGHLGTLYATTQNIVKTIEHYGEFFRCFLVTNNVPTSVADFPTSVRRCVVMGDTDSTIFTAQWWVEWYYGYVGFSDEHRAVGATMIYLASKSIKHILALMSINLGVDQDNLFEIAMKNEFYFEVFIPANVAKHYMALKAIQEGNVYSEMEEEIKGVHLKNSAISRLILSKATALMLNIMNTIRAERTVDILPILKDIGDMEREIKASILSGKVDYYKNIQIKEAEGYKLSEEESLYNTYTFWSNVFSPKYGFISPPPYGAVKIPTILANATTTNMWLNTMEDQMLAERIRASMKSRDRTDMKTFYVPEDVVGSVGIPKEIIQVVNVRKVIADTMNIFYIILETLNIMFDNKDGLVLVSDTH